MVLSCTIMYLYQIIRECLSGGAVKEMWLRAVQTQLRLLKTVKGASTYPQLNPVRWPGRADTKDLLDSNISHWFHYVTSKFTHQNDQGAWEPAGITDCLHCPCGPRPSRSLTQHVAKMKSDTTFKNTNTHRWCPAGRICPSRDTTHSTLTSLQILRAQHPTPEQLITHECVSNSINLSQGAICNHHYSL